MAVVARGDIVGAGLEGGLHHRVLGRRLAVVFDHADPIEHERHGAGLGQRAARFGEIGAHFAGGAVAVVGQRLDDDRDAAGRIALVAHLVVILALAAGRLFDGALDVVLGHVLGAGCEHGGAQARVHGRVGQAELRRHGDFARELGEDLGAHRILLALFVHDVLELTVPGHEPVPCVALSADVS